MSLDEAKCAVLMRAAEAGAFRAALDEYAHWRDDASYVLAAVAVGLLDDSEAEVWGFIFDRAGLSSAKFIAAIQAQARL